MTNEHKQPSPCFLCSTSSTPTKVPNNSKTTTLSSWPSNNLDVIFLLRNLLHIPKSLLVNHLKKCGDNPDNWISLCVQCSQLIGKARVLYQTIRKTEEELKSIQNQVLDKIRRSTLTSHQRKKQAFGGKASGTTNGTLFEEKVKLLVTKNTPLNSKGDKKDDDLRFLEADNLAKRVAIQDHPFTPKEIKDEDPPQSPAPMSPSPSPPPEVPCPSGATTEEPQVTTAVISTLPTPVTSTKKFHPGFAKRFICLECGKAFTFVRFWAEHLLKLHNIRSITCPGKGCSEKFNDNLVNFQEHWKANHLTWSGRTIPCPICGKEFKNSKSYSNHKRNIHSSNKRKEQSFICDICGVEQHTYAAWYRHRRNKHQILGTLSRKPYEPIKQILKGQLCQLCGKTIKGKANLRNHVRNVHEKRFSYSCHLCGIGMPAPVNLKFHLLSSHKDDPYTKQLEEEEGIKLWKCGVVGCGVKFLRKEKLEEHVGKFHQGGENGEGETRFKCKFCGKGFWNRQKLNGHEDVHEGKGKEDWKCDVCGKGFGTKINLKYHLKHTHKLQRKIEDK